MGFSVKADDIDARLKAIQIESYKSLKDKSDLFEDGGQIINQVSTVFQSILSRWI